MLRQILSALLVGKIFRMMSGRRGGHHYARAHRGWGHRSHGFDNLAGLMGMHRRRRSFI